MRLTLLGFIWLALAPFLMAQSSESSDDKWATLSGRITYAGSASNIVVWKRRGLQKNRNQARAPKSFVDESLQVNPKNRGLANAFVWLRGKPVSIHPKYAENATETRPVVLLKNQRLTPHALTVRTGQTLQLNNKSKLMSNLSWVPLRNKLNGPSPPDPNSVDLNPSRDESFPVPIIDHVRPWLTAYALVQKHPYMAVTDKNGRFEIKDLPIGKWEFVFWHEKFGYLREVKLNGIETNFPKGRHKVHVDPGSTDIGKIELAERKPPKAKTASD